MDLYLPFELRKKVIQKVQLSSKSPSVLLELPTVTPFVLRSSHIFRALFIPLVPSQGLTSIGPKESNPQKNWIQVTQEV